jgi:hypothetical protein
LDGFSVITTDVHMNLGLSISPQGGHGWLGHGFMKGLHALDACSSLVESRGGSGARKALSGLSPSHLAPHSLVFSPFKYGSDQAQQKVCIFPWVFLLALANFKQAGDGQGPHLSFVACEV